jgi:hypothetical protein
LVSLLSKKIKKKSQDPMNGLLGSRRLGFANSPRPISLSENSMRYSHASGRPTHRRLIRIRYIDPHSDTEEVYPLSDDGHHIRNGMAKRAARAAHARLSESVPLPEKGGLAAEFHALPPPEMPHALPLRPIETLADDHLPPFSAMWLNNPEFSERPRFEGRPPYPA